MKHEVNNKTFDEIFAQRGEQVQPENMVREGTYLLTFERGTVLHVHKYTSQGKIFRYANLMQSGRIHTHFGGVLNENDLTGCWEATPDQKEYLMSRVSRTEELVIKYTEKP